MMSYQCFSVPTLSFGAAPPVLPMPGPAAPIRPVSPVADMCFTADYWLAGLVAIVVFAVILGIGFVAGRFLLKAGIENDIIRQAKEPLQVVDALARQRFSVVSVWLAV